MSIEYDLKKKLDEIIDNAFQDIEQEKREKLKWFRLNIQLKNKKSYHGFYNAENHTIVINNISDEGNNILTLLHEVAHHIDWCIYGKTGHQKEFYEVYEKLLYSALDLDMVSLYQLKHAKQRSTDYTKVQKILDSYKPHKVKGRKKTYLIQISNAYEQKEILKENRYHWNKVSKTWDKKVESEEERDKEKDWLKELCIDDENILIKDNTKINFSL